MAARKLNIFATSSSKGFLSCLQARQGYTLVASDISSLEPHVLAHYSKDPGYMKIYGNGAVENCIYLYLGAASPKHGHLFKAAGYDSDNPAPGSIAIVKKKMADERQVYKGVVLSCTYGGGPKPLQSRFTQSGMKIPLHECSQLVHLYDKRFKRIEGFHHQLLQEWHQRGGYILTGRNRPLGIPRDKLKRQDLVAFFCQATGHDFMTRILHHQQQYRLQHKLTKVILPFIPDFHDASYWQVRDDHLDDARAMFDYGYQMFNQEAELDVSLSGAVKISKTMAGLG